MKVNGFKVGGRTYKAKKKELDKSFDYLVNLIKKECEK